MTRRVEVTVKRVGSPEAVMKNAIQTAMNKFVIEFGRSPKLRLCTFEGSFSPFECLFYLIEWER